MGQLERYGLYVLCVVIMLILGVAIWGGDESPMDVNAPHQLEHSVATPNPATAAPAAPPGAAHGDQVGLQSNATPDTGFFQQVNDGQPAHSEPVGTELAGLAGIEPATGSKPAPATPAPASAKKAEPKKKEKESAQRVRSYEVRKGDTMEKIALKVLGSRKHVDTIRKLNPNVNPSRMRPGIVLNIPWIETPGDGPRPDLLAARSEWTEYTVRSGDSASRISKRVYKTSKFYNEILEANNINDPTRMQPGTVLKIPPLR